MDVELTAVTRNRSGKGAARSLRRTDMVPAILYGPKTPSISLSVEARRLKKLLRDMGGESRLLHLSIEENNKQVMRQVIIREIQVHPARRRFLHVDFYEVPLDHAIEVEVPVELVGESLGVKKGGTLNLIRRMLSVRCLPAEIPERIQVDVTAMDLGSSIHVADLLDKVSFQIIEDANASVVNISAPEGMAKESEGSGGE